MEHWRCVVPEPVSCEVCLKLVPKSEAQSAEARDYVAYFCGLECYEKWQQGKAMPAPQQVFCEVCLKSVAKLDALMSEGRDNVAYFCSPRCYQHWLGEHEPAAPPEIQVS